MKKAIVIGASSGIGRALVLKLVKEGYQVGAAARRYEMLDTLRQEAPDSIRIRSMDVRHPEVAVRFFEELLKELNGVDLVIYNSGIDLVNTDFDWKSDYEVAQVNAMGFIALVNAALQHFRSRKHGHLVGISSFVAIRGNGKSPVYSASKAFMATYMRGLRQRLLGTSMTITDIRPGYVKTELVKNRKQAFWMVSPEMAAEGIYAAIQKKSPVAYVPKRWWVPAQVLRMIPDFIYDQIYLKKFKEPSW